MTTPQFSRVASWLRRRRPAFAVMTVAVAVVLATMQTATQSGTVRFAVIGDFGKAGTNEQAVAQAVINWNPDFVITTGDNNYEYGSASTIDVNIGQYYHSFISPYFGSYGAGASVNRFFPSLGNHDWGDGFVSPATVQPSVDYFTLPGNERYYDFVNGPVHLFALSSDSFEPDGNTFTSVQAAWFQTRVAASTSPWKLAYFHNPPYSSSAHLSGKVEDDIDWPFGDLGIDAVFSGHHHTFERLLVRNVAYFISGLGGNGKDNFTFPLPETRSRYNGDFGAMLVTATASTITYQFITKTGAVIDSYSVNAPAGPGAPNNLVGAPVPGRVDLWWKDNAANETGFAVERSSDGATYQEIGTVAANVRTYADAGVLTPASYTYRVRALLPSGVSAYSNVASVTTVPAPPAAPVLSSTSASSSAVNLTWSAVADEDGVRVYRKINNVPVMIATLGPDVTAYTDGGRMPLTTYEYLVRAFNGGGESPSSNEVSSTTTDRPLAPSNLVATASSSSQIDLVWTDNSEREDGFKIFRSIDGVTFSTLAWVAPNVTTYSNTGRAPQTTYYYYVRAYEDTGGESVSSNTASATTPGALAAPSNLTATAASTSRIDLNWTDNSTTEASFKIYRSTDGVNFVFQSSVGANVTTFASTGLTASTTYYYRVTAREAGGNESAVSNTASATTSGLPGAPSTLVATAQSGTQINLVWADNSSGETGFRIDRSTNGTTFSTLAWVGADTTSYSNTGLSPLTTYYYRVSAYNNLGSSAFSNVGSATTLSALAAPSNLQAAGITGTRVDLSWADNSSVEAGFKVYRSTDNATFTYLASVGPNVTTYSNQSVVPATTYYYKVTAYDSGGGASAFSNTATVTTPSVPAAPSGLVATALSSTRIDLTWTDNSSNETNFRIDRSTDGVNFSTAAWVGANVTSYSNTGRTPGTTYYYRVSSYNANGASASSNTASATTPP